MKFKRHIISVAAIALLLVTPMLESCRTELCYNHYATADLALSWELEWEHDYGMGHASSWDYDLYGHYYADLMPATPEWVSVARYSPAGDIAEEKYFPKDGGQLIVNTDTDPSLLLYNGDTEYIVLRDIASLPDARATSTSRTRSSITYLMEQHPGVRSMNPPDVLYSAYVEKLPFIDLHEVKRVPIKLQPRVYTYLIRYEFEAHMDHIALARGAVAGMAESVYLRDGHTSEETAILLYDCDITDFGCEARVSSFGMPGFPESFYGRADEDTADSPATLNLEIMLKNGKIVEYNFDIADQLRKQPRGGVITVRDIVIDEDLLKPDPVASGFDVDLSGWGTGIDVDLPISSPK